MDIIGVDLSGPANPADTAMVLFKETPFGLLWAGGWSGTGTKSKNGPREPQIRNGFFESDLGDRALLQVIDAITRTCSETSGAIAIGLDAPLSYQDGGGDRPGDRQLRAWIKAQGMHHGSIMSPTFQRMVYLSLRGIQLSRTLQHRIDTMENYQNVRVCEVHPGSALILRQSLDERHFLRDYKKNPDAYQQLADRLESIGILGVPAEWLNGSSHRLDAIGAALAAWHWARGRAMWLHPADPDSGHPYDYVV